MDKIKLYSKVKKPKEVCLLKATKTNERNEDGKCRYYSSCRESSSSRDIPIESLCPASRSLAAKRLVRS